MIGLVNKDHASAWRVMWASDVIYNLWTQAKAKVNNVNMSDSVRKLRSELRDIMSVMNLASLKLSNEWHYVNVLLQRCEDDLHTLMDVLRSEPDGRESQLLAARLLVTSQCFSYQLRQFDSDGNELRWVQLPDDMSPQYHSVESPAGMSDYIDQESHHTLSTPVMLISLSLLTRHPWDQSLVVACYAKLESDTSMNDQLLISSELWYNYNISCVLWSVFSLHTLSHALGTTQGQAEQRRLWRQWWIPMHSFHHRATTMKKFGRSYSPQLTIMAFLLHTTSSAPYSTLLESAACPQSAYWKKFRRTEEHRRSNVAGSKAENVVIRIMAPPATDFRYPWNELTKAVAGLGLKQMGSPPLCVIFEFDPRDALDCYEKYVCLAHYRRWDLWQIENHTPVTDAMLFRPKKHIVMDFDAMSQLQVPYSTDSCVLANHTTSAVLWIQDTMTNNWRRSRW